MSKTFKWLPAIIWVVIICWLSFSSLDSVEIPVFFSADKFAHFFMYAILELLLFYPIKKVNSSFILLSVVAILFAIATELIQHYYITNRFGEVADFVANLFGLSAVYFYLFLKNKKTSSPK